jgi:hypothetical protein
MSRQLRKVPEGWEHPKNDDGHYIPQFEKYYGDALEEWLYNHKLWELGTHPDLLEKPERKNEYPFYAMWNGNPPNDAYYRTVKYNTEELTHIQLYETVTEGTPDSPVFKASEFEQLCEYAAEHCTTFAHFKASKEQWMQMLKDDFVYHRVGNNLMF